MGTRCPGSILSAGFPVKLFSLVFLPRRPRRLILREKSRLMRIILLIFSGRTGSSSDELGWSPDGWRESPPKLKRWPEPAGIISNSLLIDPAVGPKTRPGYISWKLSELTPGMEKDFPFLSRFSPQEQGQEDGSVL